MKTTKIVSDATTRQKVDYIIFFSQMVYAYFFFVCVYMVV